MLHLGHLTAEDLEIRRRLFWSCYFWDKWVPLIFGPLLSDINHRAISLYLGRMPALTELPSDHDHAPVLCKSSTPSTT